LFSPNNQEARLVELTDVGLDGIADLDIAQVVEYWTAQSAGRMAPPLSDFHLDDISPPLLPRMIAEKRPFCHRVVWQSNRGSYFTLTTARMPLSNDGTEITGAVTATYVAP